MSDIPSELKYASSHEWARLDDNNVVTVGITDHAQDLLGDIVFVELPELETELAGSDEAGVVESVKAASDIYSPVAGVVVAINENLQEAPELVNSDPYGDGWFFKVKVEDPAALDSLLNASAYQEQVDAE